MTSPLSALVQRLSGVLRDIEWPQHSEVHASGSTIWNECASCWQDKRDGHAESCKLAAAIRDVPVLLAALGESRGEGLEEAARLCRGRAVYLQQWLDAGNGTPDQRTWHAGKLVEAEALEQEIRALSSKPSARDAEVAALVAERDALKAALTEIFDAIEQWPERECGRSFIRDVQFGRNVLQRWRAALSGGTQTKEDA